MANVKKYHTRARANLKNFYFSDSEVATLDRLSMELNLTNAEVIRRGLQYLADAHAKSKSQRQQIA